MSCCWGRQASGRPISRLAWRSPPPRARLLRSHPLRGFASRPQEPVTIRTTMSLVNHPVQQSSIGLVDRIAPVGIGTIAILIRVHPFRDQ